MAGKSTVFFLRLDVGFVGAHDLKVQRGEKVAEQVHRVPVKDDGVAAHLYAATSQEHPFM